MPSSIIDIRLIYGTTTASQKDMNALKIIMRRVMKNNEEECKKRVEIAVAGVWKDVIGAEGPPPVQVLLGERAVEKDEYEGCDFDEKDDDDESCAPCECCGEEKDEDQIAGCCNDGDCAHNIERMCVKCGTWDEEMQVWRCGECEALNNE